MAFPLSQTNGIRNVSVDYRTSRNDSNETLNAKKVAGDSAKTAGNSMRMTGAGMQVAGTGMKAAGTGIKAVGAGVTAAGAALSATGVGAIVGVPLALTGRVIGVAGMGVKTAGSATKKAGKATSAAGKRTYAAGKRMSLNTKSLSSVGKSGLLLKARIASTSVRIAAVLTPLYLVQLFCAMLSLLALGMAAAISSVIEGSFILSAAARAASFIGFDTDSLGISGGIFMLMYGMTLVIGFISLAITLMMCKLARFSPLSGEKSGMKQGVFLLAVMGYSLPIANLFPWVTLLLLTIWKYPK
jgi:hypothetical protein